MTIPGRKGYAHQVFQTVKQAASFAVSQAGKRDVYFNIHTLLKKEYYDANWKDEHGTKIGKIRWRVKQNIKACRCFFFDIDIGPDKTYKNQDDGLEALINFVKATKLPWPWVVSSGGGWHVYWPMTEAIPSDEWCGHAEKLKRVALHFKLAVDPSRTVDRSSVLRVPGTSNLKQANNPRPVLIKKRGPVTATDEMIEAIQRAGVFLAPEPGSAAAEMESRDVGLVLVGKACAVTRHLVNTADKHSEPEWYALIGMLLYVDDGVNLIHKISSKYAGYDRTETDAKIAQVRDEQTGPTRCARFGGLSPTTAKLCDACWYKQPHSSPVGTSRKMGHTYTVRDTIPPPPKPYRRLAVGGVSMDNDGVDTVISPYDIYPTMIVNDTTLEMRVARWTAVVPSKQEATVLEFSMPLRVVQDQGQLAAHLSDQGIILQFDDMKHMRRYMASYLQELQKYSKEQKQHDHFGWTEGFEEFVLPQEVISRVGTLEGQLRNLSFYNHPIYFRQQLAIIASLAAPLFYMTGQYGLILNLSGPSGASKSSALYAGAALWGNGATYVINGTNRGMSANARQQRVTVMSNLPVHVDEITYLDTDEAKDLAMSITQANERTILDQKRNEKKRISTHKSTIMITSSNGSLHEKLAIGNIAGTASSMRVFEINCPKVDHHTKTEADAFLREMHLNYGHIGPAFMGYVLLHLYAITQEVIRVMAEVDLRGNIGQEERFWSAFISVCLVTIRHAKIAGLLPFDDVAIANWLFEEQLPLMRGTVSTNYSDSIDTFMAYLNASVQDTLTVTKGMKEVSILHHPTRELGIRYELDTKTAYVSLAHLKVYCARRNVQMQSMITALEKDTGATREKMSIGKDAPGFNFGQVRVLKVSLKAQAISGRDDFQEMENKIVEFKRGTKT